jgi:uncharacterized protein YihD (DUF1040 family)
MIALIGAVGLVAFLGWQHYTNSSLYDKLTKEYFAQEAAYKKDMAELLEINSQYNLKLSKLQKAHEERVKQMEQDYQKKLNDLSKKQIVSRKKIVDDAKKDPKSLTAKVTDVFGIPPYDKGQKP